MLAAHGTVNERRTLRATRVSPDSPTRFHTAPDELSLAAGQSRVPTWPASWHEFCSKFRMNQNPEPTAANSPSGQSRQGQIRDESGRSDRSGTVSLTAEAREVASGLADEATRSAERQLTGGKERAAQAIGQLAEALRHTGATMSSSADMPMVNDYLGRAASRVEGLSDYLKRKSLTDVVGDVERFARKDPVLFMGGALLIGLLGGRFLRSAQPERRSAPGANTGQGARAGR